MAAAQLADAQELAEKLREELDEVTDKYEDQIDRLTEEFEDKVESLENRCDEQEGRIQAMEKEMGATQANHEAQLEDIRLTHEAALHALASNSGDAWEKKFDDEGNPFFENKINGETSWEDPRPLNDEGKMLKEKVNELQNQFKAFKKSFEKSRFMQKALREEIDGLEKTLGAERKEKEHIQKDLKQRDEQISQIDAKHARALERRAEESKQAQLHHLAELRRSEGNTAGALRDLADMRREATAMMESMAAELKSTYLEYGRK